MSKFRTRSELAKAAGVSLRTLCLWMRQDERLAALPRHKLIPPADVDYMCEKYNICIED